MTEEHIWRNTYVMGERRTMGNALHMGEHKCDGGTHMRSKLVYMSMYVVRRAYDGGTPFRSCPVFFSFSLSNNPALPNGRLRMVSSAYIYVYMYIYV